MEHVELQQSAAGRNKCAIRAYRHTVLANNSKITQLTALFPEFRRALGELQALTRRELLDGQTLVKWRHFKTAPFNSRLSHRQLLSAQNQTYSAVSSWRAGLEIRVRELITGSTLPALQKMLLYRVNARHAWWERQLTLPWRLNKDGEYGYASEQWAAQHQGEVQWIDVDAETLWLARRLAKAAQKRVRYPDLRRVRTINLDSFIASIEPANQKQLGRVSYWARVATLTRYKPLWIPLSTNPYYERQRRLALKPCGAVQLHLIDGGVSMSLLLEHKKSELRTTGETIGIDFGMRNALFATSNGQLLGVKMLTWLHKIDATLTSHTAELQRRGVKPRTDSIYRKLQSRIRSHVTNEIGRLLNQLADDDVKELVVEKLDFRGGGLSRRLNRILNRTGRRVVKARLDALTDKHGVTVTEIPSSYTSQQCSGCGYVHRLNRNGAKFVCRFCGKKLHADVNAARVIVSRRSRHIPDYCGARARKKTHQLLDQAHQKRWKRRPTRGAGQAIAGEPGRLSTKLVV